MDDPEEIIFSAVFPQPRAHTDLRMATNALEHYQDPALLAMERARFDESPPPYSETDQRTMSPSPIDPNEESLDRDFDDAPRESDIFESAPAAQFRTQVYLERDRLWHQQGSDRWGRRLTLPFDATIDAEKNARQNIHKLWSDMGIWAEEWVECDWQPLGFSFGAIWAHERSAFSSRDASPEITIIPVPRDECTQEGQVIRGTKIDAPKEQMIDARCFQKLSVKNHQASKPLNQFAVQVEREIKWLTDELTWRPRNGPAANVEVLAYNAVKARWLKNRIWNSDWADSELPGEAWAHEKRSAKRMSQIESYLKLNASKKKPHRDAKSSKSRKGAMSDGPPTSTTNAPTSLFASVKPKTPTELPGKRKRNTELDEDSDKPEGPKKRRQEIPGRTLRKQIKDTEATKLANKKDNNVTPRRSARIAAMRVQRESPDVPPKPNRARTRGNNGPGTKRLSTKPSNKAVTKGESLEKPQAPVKKNRKARR